MAVAVLGGVGAIAWWGQLAPVSGVVLNEVMTSNADALADASGEHPDWIELHNAGDEPVDLTGWFLAHDLDDPTRWRFPEGRIEPGGHLVVFASGQDRVGPGGELHTDFRLNQAQGEPVLLTDPDGHEVDRLDPGVVPRNVSYGRHPDRPRRTCFFVVSTPGAANAPECFDDPQVLGAPSFSVPPGFHDGPLDLEMTSEADGPVYYTLDGSRPDPDANPQATRVHDAPLSVEDRSAEPDVLSRIDTTVPGDQVDWPTHEPPDVDGPVQKATVVRARTRYGAESVATYLVGEHLRRDGLPVLSLVTDPGHLFDDERGIYVAGRTFAEYRDSDAFDPDAGGMGTPANYHQRGRDWERPALGALHDRVTLELCEADGCRAQSLGIRIHGNVTRSYAQKSLRLYARNDYTSRTIDLPLLGGNGPEGHRRLLLRNSGHLRTMLADAYLQRLLGELAADTQAYRPAVLFVNGEYWGVHNVRERYDRHYLGVVHGVDPHQVVLLSRSSDTGLVADAGPDEEAVRHQQLIDFVVDPAHDEHEVLERVEREMDVASFFDFVIAHLWAGNRDWPNNNVRLWRDPTGDPGRQPDPAEGVRDGRWRWMVFDLDHFGGQDYDPGYDPLVDGLAPDPDADEPWYPELFDRLMGIDELRDAFVARLDELLEQRLSPQAAVALLDELEALLADEMVHHVARWSIPASVDEWHANLERLRTFVAERPERLRAQVADRLASG